MEEWKLMMWGGFRCRLGWLGVGWVEEEGGWVGTVVLGGLLMMGGGGGLSGGCRWIWAGAGGRACKVLALIGLGLVSCLVGLGVPLCEGAPVRLDVPGL